MILSLRREGGRRVLRPLPNAANRAGDNQSDANKQMADDDFYTKATGGSNADFCARGVATEYLGGNAKPSDWTACKDHLKELYKHPKATVLETTGFTQGSQFFGPYIGKTLGGVLGLFANGIPGFEYFGKMIFGNDQRPAAADKLGIGQDPPNWNGLANKIHGDTFEAIGKAASDPQGVAEMNAAAYEYALGGAHGDSIVNVGLAKGEGEDWFKVRAQQLTDQAAAIAEASQARADEAIRSRAAGMLEAGGELAKCGDEACRKRLLVAAYVAASREKADATAFEYDHFNHLVRDSLGGEPGWISSPQRSAAVARSALVDTGNDLLIQRALQDGLTPEDVKAAAAAMKARVPPDSPDYQTIAEEAGKLASQAGPIAAEGSSESGGVTAGVIVTGLAVAAAAAYHWRRPLLALWRKLV